MEWTSGGFDVTSKPQELEVLQLVAVEVAGHVDAFTPDDDDFVAVQDELGDDGGQSADQMATAVDNNRLWA